MATLHGSPDAVERDGARLWAREARLRTWPTASTRRPSELARTVQLTAPIGSRGSPPTSPTHGRLPGQLRPRLFAYDVPAGEAERDQGPASRFWTEDQLLRLIGFGLLKDVHRHPGHDRGPEHQGRRTWCSSSTANIRPPARAPRPSCWTATRFTEARAGSRSAQPSATDAVVPGARPITGVTVDFKRYPRGPLPASDAPQLDRNLAAGQRPSRVAGTTGKMPHRVWPTTRSSRSPGSVITLVSTDGLTTEGAKGPSRSPRSSTTRTFQQSALYTGLALVFANNGFNASRPRAGDTITRRLGQNWSSDGFVRRLAGQGRLPAGRTRVCSQNKSDPGEVLPRGTAVQRERPRS